MEPSNQDMPKIIKFLQNDGYEFQKIDYNPRFGGSARAIFEKMTHINEINGIKKISIIFNLQHKNSVNTFKIEKMIKYIYCLILLGPNLYTTR